MDNLNYEDYQSALNTRFAIEAEDLRVELELYQISEKQVTPNQELYWLMFRGPKDKPLPQMLYHLKHESLGDVALFLVPVGEDPEGFQYQAVFNRLIKS